MRRSVPPRARRGHPASPGLAVIPVSAAFAANGASAVFTKSSDWGSGYEGKYTIANGSSSSLTWRVEFDLPAGATISSFWDCRAHQDRQPRGRGRNLERDPRRRRQHQLRLDRRTGRHHAGQLHPQRRLL